MNDLHPIVRPLLTALIVGALPLLSHAQSQPLPNAGSLLQQTQPAPPAAPAAAAPGLTLTRPSDAGLPASVPFDVKTVRLTGNTRFDTPTLHALVADAEGRTLVLSQLGELASRITRYYQDHGQPLTRAIIPPQTIQAGVVTIEILEARYGGIALANRSRVRPSLLDATLAPLQGGQAIEQGPLDRALLLLSDIPGTQVAATMVPGDTVGTSNLRVDVAPGNAVSGRVALDNHGSRYTGRLRLGGAVDIANPLQHGDVLSANVVTSGSGMSYARLGYETLLNGQGTRLGGSFSALHYALGDDQAALQAHGTAQVASLWARHPFMRSRNTNVSGQWQFDDLRLRDHIDASAIKSDRHLQSVTLSVAGDTADSFGSGGSNTWSVAWQAGRVAFDDADAEQADAASLRARGGFSKWNVGVTRLQGLGRDSTLFVALSWQWASKNLDSSAKMSVGGPYSVRAYDSGALSGDSGGLATVELRHPVGALWQGRLSAALFIDSAHITVNKNAWTTGSNSATLSGAGVDLRWASGPWAANAYVAAPVGSTPDLVGASNHVRAGLEVRRAFWL
jgi:hemolysin activation/secretion protein